MRINQQIHFPDPPKEWSLKWGREFIQRLSDVLRKHDNVVDGNLGFGDGTDIDNMVGKWIDYTTNAVAGTEDSISHNLGVVPLGFILVKPPASGVINRGPTAWTSTTIYLTCTQASQTAKLFILIPSQGIIT